MKKKIYTNREEAEKDLKPGFQINAKNTLSLCHSVLFQTEYSDGWEIIKSPKIKE